MPTLTSGVPVSLYVPLDATITVTPPVGRGRVTISGRAVDGGQVVPRAITTPTDILISAGSRVTLLSEGGNGSYSGTESNEIAGVQAGGPKLVGLLLDGDSLSAQNHNELSPLTGAAQTGGTATITVSGLTAVPGQRIKLGNFGDPRWNGIFTILTAAGTTSTFAIDPAADASPGIGSRSQAVCSLLSQRTASGDYVWAEMVNGVNYTLIDNVALGGRTLAEINEDFASGPGRYRACLIDFCGGTNDPKNGIATAVSSAALEAYIVKAIARGHKVLLNTVPALAGAANTADVKAKTLALNAEIRRLAIAYRQPLFDRYTALINPASADTLAANIDSSDNIHLTPTGARICGVGKAAIYAAHVPTRRVALPATTSDTIGTITTSANIIDGFFAGTGGSGGAGSVATGWTLAPTTITVTGSKGSGSVGATQILTLSGASGSFTFTGTSVHAQLVAGASYELVGKIALANFAAGIRVTVAIETNTGEVRALATRSATTPLPTADGTIIFRSDPFTVLAGSVPTAFRPKLTVVTTGVPGGTETITLEDWAINRLS